MRNLRKLFLIFLFLSLSSLAFADMTIYFKDGSSRQVNKIQFKEEQADLYLVGGSIMTVRVSMLDLPSSGIFNPKGTYGGSDMRTGSARPSTGISAAPQEQTKFKQQWDESTEEVVASKGYESIQPGDTAHVVSRTPNVVTIIYREGSGNYRRLLMESSAFYDVFESPKKEESRPVLPAEPYRPPVVEKPQVAPAEPSIPETPVTPQPVSPPVSATKPNPVETKTKSSFVMPIVFSGAMIVAIVGFAVVTLRKRNALSIEPARLARVERELRDYHLGNWLKQNLPTNQLVELCVNQFYSDNPKALGLSLRILEREPKSLVMTSIMRQGKNSAQAEVFYEHLKSRVDLSRSLVDQVAHKMGLYPSDFQAPAGTAGTVARAGVAPRVTGPQEQILIVNRPTSVTVCAILLFLSSVATAVFIFTSVPYADEVRKAIGLPGLYISIVFTLMCAYGYWTMKRWGVFLYALEPLIRFFMGVPTGLIAVPLLIVVFGMIHLDEMTWK